MSQLQRFSNFLMPPPPPLPPPSLCSSPACFGWQGRGGHEISWAAALLFGRASCCDCSGNVYRRDVCPPGLSIRIPDIPQVTFFAACVMLTIGFQHDRTYVYIIYMPVFGLRTTHMGLITWHHLVDKALFGPRLRHHRWYRFPFPPPAPLCRSLHGLALKRHGCVTRA